MTTLSALYQDLRKTLRDAGMDTPDLDARLLITHALGGAPEDVLLKPDRDVDVNHPVLRDVIARHMKGEPISKIMGHREFYGLDFIVNKNVLDPRADSEVLIDAARDHLRGMGDPSILDICTGSGCLAITLLTLFREGQGVATDLSQNALAVAAENAKRLDVHERLKLVHTSYVDNITDRFDCIVCNPPYIRTGDIDGLSDSVRLYDPLMALDGGVDGLLAYKTLFPQIRNLLGREGMAFFEIGADQNDDIRKLAESCGLHVRDTFTDLGGHLRVVALS